ncbi:MAG: Rpn family recombination-promoting nuclease/putative transposase [Saprospiraceae bacterium]|nr:Rpn family recombination-promoting nuclease/putative transposase [Saprospiraceae bacterium]
MKKKPHPQPHDLLFAEVFSRTEVAASFIKNFAGDELPLQKLKLETLRLEPSSYVKPDLKRFYSDLVFSCEYGEESVEISIIKEHKSTPPIDPHFQLLDYISEKWRQESKQKKKRTPVIAILLYHGKQRWQHRPMGAYIHGMDDELACFNPLFEFILVDLAKYEDEFILRLNTLFLVNTLLMFKHSGDSDYVRQNIGKVFVYAERYEVLDEGKKFIATILLYLTKTTELSADEIVDLAVNFSPLKSEAMVGYTLWDYELALRKAEGKAEGKALGKAEGKALKEFIIIQRAWSKGIAPELIAEIGDIPLENVKSVITTLEAEKKQQPLKKAANPKKRQ